MRIELSGYDSGKALDVWERSTANGAQTVYSGGSMLEAMRAAVGSLTPGRTSQERVVVRGSGTGSPGGKLPDRRWEEQCDDRGGG